MATSIIGLSKHHPFPLRGGVGTILQRATEGGDWVSAATAPHDQHAAEGAGKPIISSKVPG